LGLGIDQDVPLVPENAQVGLDTALRVQEQGVDAAVYLRWHLVGEDGVQHPDGTLAGQPQDGLMEEANQGCALEEGCVPCVREISRRYRSVVSHISVF
jgi:hypothetical protein